VSRGAFPAYCAFPSRDVVDEVVTGALEIQRGSETLPAQVERMEQRPMFKMNRSSFAERALTFRFFGAGGVRYAAVAAAHLPASGGRG